MLSIWIDICFPPINVTQLPVKEGQGDAKDIAFREYLDTSLANQSTARVRRTDRISNGIGSVGTVS